MHAQHTLSEFLDQWTVLLAEVSESPRLDAEVLFRMASGFREVDLISKARDVLDRSLVDLTRKLLNRRSEGEPIAYITGHKEFYSLDFKVNKYVLIPRPETEMLVDYALGLIQQHTIKHVLDLGTGSGAVAIAIACNSPQVQVCGVEQSSKAIKVADYNVNQLGLNNVEIMQSDWYSALKSRKFDLIVSNPPYVDPEDKHLHLGDVQFEPRNALVSGQQGIADIAHIIRHARPHLNLGGWLALEHGYDQGERAQTIFRDSGFNQAKTLQDLAMHDRVTYARYGE